MRLLKCILFENRCYKKGLRIKPQGVMVHSTGANNPTLKRYVQPVDKNEGKEELQRMLGVNTHSNHWNRGNLSKCVHAFIGKLEDGSVATVQTLPFDRRGWHCAGAGNNTHIGFEICEDGLNDKDYFDKVYKEAVEFTAYLCQLYNFDPLKEGVVICHCEGYDRGIASNHGDVMHWFPLFGKSMDTFRNDVANKIKEEDEDMVTYKTINDIPAWYKPTIQKLVNEGLLKGEGNGILNLTEIECRIYTVLDRAGKLK